MNVNNDTRKLVVRKVFSKNSFDRFGDDLIELIVGHLPIKEKFKFECLSIRIQSLIFNKQIVLKTNPNEKVFPYKTFGAFSYKRLQEVLTKLEFLTTIEFFGNIIINSQVIKLIADHCPHLRHLEIDKLCLISELSPQCIEYFGQKCGPNLKSFIVEREVDKNLAKLLGYASNLETLKVKRLSDLTKNELKFPKLKEITVTTKVESELIDFQDQYRSTLEILKIVIDIKAVAINGVSQLISNFGKMTNLRSLDMTITNVANAKLMLTGLTEIANNCGQLTDLSFGVHFDRTLSTVEDHYLIRLSSFAKFTSLSSLKITIERSFGATIDQTSPFGSFKDIKTLNKLKHLSLDLGYLEDETFVDIGLYLPQLESIVINAKKSNLNNQCLCDKALHYLAELRSLRSLEIVFYDSRYTTVLNNVHMADIVLQEGLDWPLLWVSSTPPKVTDFGIKHMLDNCINLQRIVLGTYNGICCLNISFKTIEEFIAKARNNRKTRFYLSIDAKIMNLNSDEISHSLNRMYDNLTVRLPLKRSAKHFPTLVQNL